MIVVEVIFIVCMLLWLLSLSPQVAPTFTYRGVFAWLAVLCIAILAHVIPIGHL